MQTHSRHAQRGFFDKTEIIINVVLESATTVFFGIFTSIIDQTRGS